MEQLNQKPNGLRALATASSRTPKGRLIVDEGPKTNELPPEMPKVESKPITQPEQNNAPLTSFVAASPLPGVAPLSAEQIEAMKALMLAQGFTVKRDIKYVKQSFEVEETLLRRFQEMYPVLGFTKVKQAFNEMLRSWIETNQTEFNRRNSR